MTSLALGAHAELAEKQAVLAVACFLDICSPTSRYANFLTAPIPSLKLWCNVCVRNKPFTLAHIRPKEHARKFSAVMEHGSMRVTKHAARAFFHVGRAFDERKQYCVQCDSVSKTPWESVERMRSLRRASANHRGHHMDQADPAKQMAMDYGEG